MSSLSSGNEFSQDRVGAQMRLNWVADTMFPRLKKYMLSQWKTRGYIEEKDNGSFTKR